MLYYKLSTILAHCYNAFMAFSVFHVAFLTLSLQKGKRINGNKASYIYIVLFVLFHW